VSVAAPRRRTPSRPARPRPRPQGAARPRKPVRSRTFGRAASVPSYITVAVVGAIMFAIVTLQIQALRTNMAAGKIDTQVRALESQNQNDRAAYASRFPRATVEETAQGLGMILPSPEAYRSLRVPRR
jgi:hypothetical protein